MVKKAIVTLAYGPDKPFYNDYFIPTLRAYAQKYNYDFYCLDELPDKRIDRSSPVELVQLQKLLICSDDWTLKYDFLVWMDSDMIININQAPDVIEGIPEGKIGCVNERKMFKYEFSQKVWERWRPDLNQSTGKDYYKAYGYPDGFDDQFQGGVYVFQPKYHSQFLKDVYNKYVPAIINGDKKNGDQGVIGYEAMKLGLEYWLDERWNMVWVLYRFLLYPFLNNRDHTSLLREALKNVYDLGYVLHMAGHVDWELLITDV